MLDTCAVIWLGQGVALSSTVTANIADAAAQSRLLVSTVSAWEIGQISRRRPGHPRALEFQPDPKTWFDRFMARSGSQEVRLTKDIMIDASWLPGDLHPDPADRLLIATARDRNLTIITRDRVILAYAEAGHVRAIAC